MFLRLISLLLWKRNRMPVYLIHSVTERCNARCTHCFVDKDGGKRELTLEEIAGVCERMGKDLFHVCLSGGEPFLRADLPEIARTYFEKTPAQVIRISTNGYLTDRIVAGTRRLLEHASCRNVVVEISLDDIGARHDRIRLLERSFDRAIQTYKALEALQEEFDNFFVNVNVTVCKSNQERLLELYAYLKNQLGIRNISMTLTRGTPDDPIEKHVDMDNYRAFAETVEKDLMQQDVPGYSGLLHGHLVNAQNVLARQRIIETVLSNKFISRCYAGNLAGVLESDGRLRPCELRPEVFGNVREQKFDELWRSEQAQQFQKDCASCYCTHECFVAPNIVFNPRYTPRMLQLAGAMMLRHYKRKVTRTLRGAGRGLTVRGRTPREEPSHVTQPEIEPRPKPKRGLPIVHDAHVEEL
jgi:MoaA/NifB/PqqE/SkfB family radical SAM enzyme